MPTLNNVKWIMQKLRGFRKGRHNQAALLDLKYAPDTLSSAMFPLN